MRAFALLLLLAVFDCAQGKPLRGLYFWGEEVETFHLCESPEAFWVTAPEELLTPLRAKVEAARESGDKHYPPIYAEVVGTLDRDSGRDPVAQKYDGVLRVAEVISTSDTLPPGCLRPLEDDFARRLNIAEEKWVRSKVETYSYVVDVGCFICETPVRIRVVDGRCTSQVRRGWFWRRSECAGGIPALLAEIRADLQNRPRKIRGEFDSAYGYPRYYFVDPETSLSDHGWGFQIRDFNLGRQ